MHTCVYKYKRGIDENRRLIRGAGAENNFLCQALSANPGCWAKWRRWNWPSSLYE